MKYQNIVVSSLIIVVGLVSITNAYQMDELKKQRLAKGPIIMPPPKEITYGSETAFIDPCNFQIEVDESKVGAHHVKNIAQHYLDIYFGEIKDCSQIKKDVNGKSI